MGKFSRAKGCREERALVQHLRELGFQNVRRVPLSGAATGFKHDALAEKNGKEYTFELKARRDAFKWLYAFVEAHGHRWALGNEMVAVAYDPEGAEKVGFDTPFLTCPEEHVKLVKRMLKLKDLCKGSEFLVVKNNGKRRLFLRFWP